MFLSHSWIPPASLIIVIVTSLIPGRVKCKDARPHFNWCKSSRVRGGGGWTVPATLSYTGDSFNLEPRLSDPECEESSWKREVIVAKSSGEAVSDSDFLPSGYYRWKLEFYHPSEYCLERIAAGEAVIRRCSKQCSHSIPCFSVCCPLGLGLNVASASCQPLPGNSRFSSDVSNYGIPVVDQNNDLLSPEEIQFMKPHFTQAKSFRKNCKSSGGTPAEEFIQENQTMQQIAFHDNGELSILITGETVRLSADNYCVDKWADEGYTNSLTTVHACLHKDHLETNETLRRRQFILGIVLAIVSVFPVLTFVVYAFVLQQSNVHGYTVMSLSSVMFFMYVFLSVSNLINAVEERSTSKTFRCKAIAFLANYFFLSLFCWLTVICFDLWWTFRRIKPSGRRKMLKYISYAAFGWGTPLVFVFTGAMLDTYYSCVDTVSTRCSVTPPKYGVSNCFLSEEGLGIYLYYPAAILLVVNMGFFVMTVVKLREYQASTRVATENATGKTKVFTLSIKIFLVMGIFWIFEVISWCYDDKGWYWFIMDLLKSLQAVAIFIVFACKKQTWEEVQNVHRRFRTTVFTPTVSTEFSLASK